MSNFLLHTKKTGRKDPRASRHTGLLSFSSFSLSLSLFFSLSLSLSLSVYAGHTGDPTSVVAVREHELAAIQDWVAAFNDAYAHTIA